MFKLARCCPRFATAALGPCIVDADEQRVFTQLRATAHGTAPLAAEVVVGELADALGIPTPARCLVEFQANLESDKVSSPFSAPD
ncbi:MAG: hypothetical protein ABI548_09225 [Polyangiaceae bacterium]